MEPGNVSLESIILPEGIIIPFDDSLKMFTFVRDHLGSTRAIVDIPNNEVCEENDYYAFGGTIQNGSDKLIDNRWRYAGKEEQSAVAHLPYLDYGARLYNPGLGRWLSPDPMAEKYYGMSPYVFCADDPVNNIDIFGLIQWPVRGTYKTANRNHLNNYGEERNTHIHRGLDINFGNKQFIEKGAPVYATHSGKVVRLVRELDGTLGGRRIGIESAEGENIVRTNYMHLCDVDEGIEIGGEVKEGQLIGYIGGSGRDNENAYPYHLHYELIINGEYINPAIDEDILINPMIYIPLYYDTIQESVVCAEKNSILPIPAYVVLQNINTVL